MSRQAFESHHCRSVGQGPNFLEIDPVKFQQVGKPRIKQTMKQQVTSRRLAKMRQRLAERKDEACVCVSIDFNIYQLSIYEAYLGIRQFKSRWITGKGFGLVFVRALEPGASRRALQGHASKGQQQGFRVERNCCTCYCLLSIFFLASLFLLAYRNRLRVAFYSALRRAHCMSSDSANPWQADSRQTQA